MPKATEVADIADKKAGVVVVGYQPGLLDKGTAQGELKKLSGETGMFDSIPDEQIQQNMGVSYQDQQAMRDSLAGLTIDTVPTADGGAGSGNFNHAGRPGQVGGSGGGAWTEKITLDKQARERYDNLLLKAKTSDGVEIRPLSEHVYDRAAQRGISPQQILTAMSGRSELSRVDPRCRSYDNGGVRVVVNRQTGNMVSVMFRKGAK